MRLHLKEMLKNENDVMMLAFELFLRSLRCLYDQKEVEKPVLFHSLCRCIKTHPIRCLSVTEANTNAMSGIQTLTN